MKVPVLLDTQLMVLLVVGMTSVPIIGKHKNLTAFTDEDFDLLLILLGEDPELILLPNVISESANLLRQHRNPERSAILTTFKDIVLRHIERYVASAVLVQRPDYKRLGITDTAILVACAESKCEILTADAELYVRASGDGLRAINFNHKREEFGLY